MAAGVDRSLLLGEIADLERRLCELRRKAEGLIEREPLPEGDIALLVCRVAHDPVAFLQDDVDEVVLMSKLSSLPGAVPWVVGMLDYRGCPVPVVDVWARIHGVQRRPLLTDLIVIFRLDGRPVGLLVQEIHEVCRLPSGGVEQPSAGLVQAPFLLGLVRRAGKATALLSVRLLLESSGLLASESAA